MARAESGRGSLVERDGSVVRLPALARLPVGAVFAVGDTQIDKIVTTADADAVRRRKERQAGREVWFVDDDGGISEIHGSLLSPDAHALDQRLTALAATVCEHDPGNSEERGAGALVQRMAAGADRLGCRCGRLECAAGTRLAAAPVVIHVIAEHAAVSGAGSGLVSEVGAGGLISPELVAELAASAKLVELVHPVDAAPEPGYVPSAALADFVRCRDLTCRWPGCDRSAQDCDLDHTIPYANGGPTHASNLKCYCRTHYQTITFELGETWLVETCCCMPGCRITHRDRPTRHWIGAPDHKDTQRIRRRWTPFRVGA